VFRAQGQVLGSNPPSPARVIILLLVFLKVGGAVGPGWQVRAAVGHHGWSVGPLWKPAGPCYRSTMQVAGSSPGWQLVGPGWCVHDSISVRNGYDT
jgi:hypothetical protein